MDLTDVLVMGIPILVAVIVYFCMQRPANTPPPSRARVTEPKLSRIPIVTITANSILLSPDGQLQPSTRTALAKLSRTVSVYVFVVVADFEEQRAAEQQIAAQFKDLVDPEQILYCQTPTGRSSMARQLEPALHIDYDPETLHLVSIFHPSVLIGGGAESPYAAAQFGTFEEFVSNGSRAQFPFLRD
jgi:hypothetical protein